MIFHGNKIATISFWFLVVLTIAAVFAEFLVPDPYTQDVTLALTKPSLSHIFGMDHLGRDLGARILYGARVSLLVGIGSAVIALVFGTILGAVAAYVGGRTDAIIMRFVDIWYSFPALLLIVLVKEVIEQGNPKRGVWAILFALILKICIFHKKD